jgi:hypothetical protein
LTSFRQIEANRRNARLSTRPVGGSNAPHVCVITGAILRRAGDLIQIFNVGIGTRSTTAFFRRVIHKMRDLGQALAVGPAAHDVTHATVGPK